MSAEAPKVRTHSVRETVGTVGVVDRHIVTWVCRGCGERWEGGSREDLERQPCGTPEVSL